MWGAGDGGTADDNKKSISLHLTSAERNLKPGGMTLTPPSAPGNTIALCNLPSGGSSALNQTKSLTNRRNMGNALPGQVRNTFQGIAIDDDKYSICVLLRLYFPVTRYDVIACVLCWPSLLLLFCTHEPQPQAQPASCNCINKRACI